MITSASNAQVKRVRALLSDRKARTEARAFVAEGVRLVEEGVNAGVLPVLILFSEGLTERGQRLLDRLAGDDVPAEEISPELMRRLSDTQTPQGILAVFPWPSLPAPSRPDFLFIADGVQDPGNLGTLLRSAAAAGVQEFLLTTHTTDIYGPKVLRAGMGAHFRIPIQYAEWSELSKSYHPELRFYLAEAHGGTPPWEADLRRPLALCVGGEAEGPSDEARRVSDEALTIPLAGKMESLNAAAAAAVLLFEVVRQRSEQRTP
jgi:TrmH family RNA methyltransferase